MRRVAEGLAAAAFLWAVAAALAFCCLATWGS